MVRINLLIGMFESNSALLTQLYRHTGYRIYGSLDLHALTNSKAGYGEPKEVVELNERLFSHNATRWFEPRSISQLMTWSDDSEVCQLRATYINALGSHSIINDPRLSYTLPLWQKTMAEAGHDISIVIPLQHPLTYAYHMHHKHHMSTRLAFALWVAYTLAIETHSRTHQRIFISHDAITNDWKRACLPIINHLAPDGLSHNIIAQLDAHVHMMRQTTSAVPPISRHISQMPIAQLACDVYDTINREIITPDLMTALQQQFDEELCDSSYHHDIGQFDVVYSDIFLDTEARIQALHKSQNDQIRQINETHNQKITALQQQHSAHIVTLNAQFSEITAKYKTDAEDMHASFTQEILHLNNKISSMQTEITWHTNITMQQQRTLDTLSWAIRIMELKERIQRLWSRQ